MTFIINYFLFAFDLRSDHTITSLICSYIFGTFILLTHGKVTARLHESFRDEFISTWKSKSRLHKSFRDEFISISGCFLVAVYMISFRDGIILVLSTGTGDEVSFRDEKSM